MALNVEKPMSVVETDPIGTVPVMVMVPALEDVVWFDKKTPAEFNIEEAEDVPVSVRDVEDCKFP